MKRFHAMQARFFGTIVAVAVTMVSVASAQWTAGMDAPVPTDYWGFGAATLDGTVYTMGGVSGTTIQNTILAYDIAADSWSTKGNLFQGVYNTAAAALDGKVYLIGGQVGGQGNATYQSGVAVYDPQGGSVTAGMALPVALVRHTAVTVDGKIYVLGGIYRNPSGTGDLVGTDVHVFTPGAGWSTITNSLPLNFFWGQATAIDNKIYIAGGVTVNQQGQFIVNLAFQGTVNGSTISWTPIANLPVGVYGGSMTSIDGRPLLVGGTNGTDGYRNAYLYDPQKNVWETFYQTAGTLNQSRVSGDGSTAVLIGGVGSKAVYTANLAESVPVASFGQNQILVSAEPGGSVVQRSIVVGNGGLAELNVTSEVPVDAQGWLTVGDVDVAAGSTANLTFTIDPSSLAEGAYTTTVTLMHNDESQDPHEVAVQLFVGELPEKQDLNVVIEEASGDWCGWCPDGQKYLRQLEADFPDEVIILSYHGGSATEPLAIPAGTQILSMLGTTGFPSAAINRIRFAGESSLMVNRGDWTPYTQAVLNAFDRAPATLTIDEYEYNPETRTVTATVSVTTADWMPVSTSYAISAVVTQNNIYTSQVDYVDGDHDSYHQAHAVRHVWPGASGSPLSLSSTQTVEGYMTPGRTVTREISFTIPESSGLAQYEILPEDSHITFFVHTSAAGQPGMILQAQQRELESDFTPGPAISVNWGSSQEKNINPEETASFDVVVTNNTSEPATVTLTRATNSMPSGWMSEICTGPSDCDDADLVTYTIPADGSHTFSLKVYGANAEQTGNVMLVVSSGEVTQQQEFTVNTGTTGVKVAGESNGLSLASVTPNPASTVARVEVTIPTAAETTLEVYTTAGEKVATLFQGRLESGTRQINADVTGLESGKYVLVLTSGETKVSRTLTVVR